MRHNLACDSREYGATVLIIQPGGRFPERPCAVCAWKMFVLRRLRVIHRSPARTCTRSGSGSGSASASASALGVVVCAAHRAVAHRCRLAAVVRFFEMLTQADSTGVDGFRRADLLSASQNDGSAGVGGCRGRIAKRLNRAGASSVVVVVVGGGEGGYSASQPWHGELLRKVYNSRHRAGRIALVISAHVQATDSHVYMLHNGVD